MDIISNKNISCFYILVNHKGQVIYDMVFESIIKSKENFNKDLLNIETVVTELERELINIVKKYFP